MKRILAATAALLALAACGTPPAAQHHAGGALSPPPAAASSPVPAPVLHQVHDPGQVTGTLTGPCHALGGGQLPDPACTPGAYDPAITATVLCAPGYSTSTYRAPSSQTSAFKYQVAYPAYGIADIPGTLSELDHLVSLELGGANDASNLWPELGPIPNAKDAVENQLHAWVCAATGAEAETRLREAQVAIAADWPTALAVLHVGAGSALSGPGG